MSEKGSAGRDKRRNAPKGTFEVSLGSWVRPLKTEYPVNLTRRRDSSLIDIIYSWGSVEDLMSQEETFEKVKKIVAEQLEIDDLSKVTPEANFATDLGADSLDTVELVMALEEEFDIEIPDEEAEKILTVGAVVDYISNKVTTSA